MIKFAAILTSAFLACSGIFAPVRDDTASRTAALRCNRTVIACYGQHAWSGCGFLPGCDLGGCKWKDCNPSGCDAPTCPPEVQPTATPAPTSAPTQSPAPTQAPTAAPAPTDDADALPGVSAYAQEVVRLVNIERADAGLAPLTMDATLSAAAQVRAQEIDVSFSHTRPDGTSCFTVLKEFGIGYRACGENIAKGSPSPARVVEGWMNSAGHRANILSANFTTIGVGVFADAAGTLHWAQLFTA